MAPAMRPSAIGLPVQPAVRHMACFPIHSSRRPFIHLSWGGSSNSRKWAGFTVVTCGKPHDFYADRVFGKQWFSRHRVQRDRPATCNTP